MWWEGFGDGSGGWWALGHWWCSGDATGGSNLLTGYSNFFIHELQRGFDTDVLISTLFCYFFFVSFELNLFWKPSVRDSGCSQVSCSQVPRKPSVTPTNPHGSTALAFDPSTSTNRHTHTHATTAAAATPKTHRDPTGRHMPGQRLLGHGLRGYATAAATRRPRLKSALSLDHVRPTPCPNIHIHTAGWPV